MQVFIRSREMPHTVFRHNGDSLQVSSVVVHEDSEADHGERKKTEFESRVPHVQRDAGVDHHATDLKQQEQDHRYEQQHLFCLVLHM